ncbi:hypothetical protein CAD93_25765 [Salmonella enterica subsp. enterica serovar Tennessee]|nr:hypothetical protein [Salmonella enterica subsp. enterica serovar Tennessee]
MGGTTKEKKRVKTGVLKGVVARSARRCAAFDPGGFGWAFSPDITPMRHVIRASSPHGMPHAVRSREYTPASMAAKRPPHELHALASLFCLTR